MFQSFLRLVKYAAAVPVILLPSGATGLDDESRIADLRSLGWTVIEKREETKKLPGEKPYNNLLRIIQVTYFVFEKDGERKACWISYDSQRDQIREGCEPTE